MSKPLQRLGLINRSAELKEITDHFEKLSGPTLLYFEGEGGIGKTALLEAALDKLKRKRRGRIAQTIVDLYHLDYQLPQGFAKGIIEALGAEESFTTYLHQIEELRERSSKGVVPSQEEWDASWEQFANDLTQLAKDSPLVIAVDTVEVLDYLTDIFQSENQLPYISFTNLMEKMIALFKKLEGPSLWLMAGRPSEVGKKLEEEGILSSKIRLNPLDENATIQYIEALAQGLEENEQERLKRIIEHYGQNLYRETGGRPILLAMVADILAQGGALPNTFYQDHSSETTKDELEKRLLRHLLETENIGETIRKMALLHKGVNASLLARLQLSSEEDARQELEQVARLVLVKKRPTGDRPYFLHDEIYAMFERHPRYLPPNEDRDHYWKQIDEYYREEEKKLSPKKAVRSFEKLRLYELRAEFLHYRLWRNPQKGFQYYFLHSEDALDARERDLFLLLRGELMRTWKELEKFHKIPQDIIQWIQSDAAIRWGIYKLMLEDNPSEAKSLFEEFRQWRDRKGITSAPWDELHLQLYENVIKIKQGKVKEAQDSLRQLQKDLREQEQKNRDLYWILQAYTFAYQGYADRLRGEYYLAIEHYQEAAALFRRLHLNALITVLSNQAYAMSMIGWERRARQAVAEAEELARTADNYYQHVVVLNVGCIVETMAGHLNSAIKYADQAMTILEQERIQDPRLRARLYTSRARAYRYTWNRYFVQRRYDDRELRDAIKRARDDIEQAIQITPDDINPYLVERWGEAGCVYREIAHLYKKVQEEDLSDLGGSELKFHDVIKNRRAERFLLAAAGVMELPAGPLPGKLAAARVAGWEKRIKEMINNVLAGDPYLASLALVNLGWHWLYQGEKQELLEAIYNLVYRIIPEDYHLPSPRRQRKKANVLLWSVLGKVEMLLFHVALQDWAELSDKERDQLLEENVWHVVYALEYNHLMGEAPYDLRRAEEGLNRLILDVEDWEQCLVYRLYKYGEGAVQKLREKGFSKLNEEPATFLQWLEERFGPKRIWMEDRG